MTSLSLAVTGGIACGKSTVLLLLRSALALESNQVFDADHFVRQLFKDPAILAEISTAFPDAVSDGKINRTRLRAAIFASADDRKKLQTILHPRVSRAWRQALADCRAANRAFLAEIPLLFEVGAEDMFDRVIVVASSPSVQRDRLQNERGIHGEVAMGMMSAQIPLASKIEKASHVLWNDGSLESLKDQIAFLLPLVSSRK